MWIEDLTMTEFSAGLEKTRSVVIPFGSTEEHGDHLPLSTDTLQAISVARRLAERRPLFVAPPIPYGVCRSTRHHPGTLSISTTSLRALTLDLIASLYQQGLRNMVLLSGHAGKTHMACLVDAGEEALERFAELHIAVVTEYDLAWRAGRGLVETEGDSHAGEIETSRILHSHPQLVKGEGRREFPNFPEGILVRDKQACWPGGVWGDPTRASADKGARLEELVVEALGRLLERLESYRD